MNFNRIHVLIFGLCLPATSTYPAQSTQKKQPVAKQERAHTGNLGANLQHHTQQVERSLHKIVQSLVATEKTILLDANDQESIYKAVADARNMWQLIETDAPAPAEARVTITNILGSIASAIFGPEEDAVVADRARRQARHNGALNSFFDHIEILRRKIQQLPTSGISTDTNKTDGTTQAKTANFHQTLSLYREHMQASMNTLSALRQTFDTYLERGINDGWPNESEMLGSSDRNLVKELRTFFDITKSQLAAKQHALRQTIRKMEPTLAALEGILATCSRILEKRDAGNITSLTEANIGVMLGRDLQNYSDVLSAHRTRTLEEINTRRIQEEQALSMIKPMRNKVYIDETTIIKDRSSSIHKDDSLIHEDKLVHELWDVSSESMHVLRNLNTLFAVINGKPFQIANQEKIEQDLGENLMKSNLRQLMVTKGESVVNDFRNGRSQQQNTQDQSWASWVFSGAIDRITGSNLGSKAMEIAGGKSLDLHGLLRQIYPDQIELAVQEIAATKADAGASQEQELSEVATKIRNTLDNICPEMPALMQDYFTQEPMVDYVHESKKDLFDDNYTNVLIRTKNQDLLLYDIAARTRFRAGRLSGNLKLRVKELEQKTGHKYEEIMRILKDPSTPLNSPWKLFKLPPFLVRSLEGIICTANNWNDQPAEQQNIVLKKEEENDSSKPSGIFGSIWKKVVNVKNMVTKHAGNALTFTKNVMCKVLGKKRVNYVANKVEKIRDMGDRFYTGVKQRLACACLKVIRVFASEEIAKIEQAIREGRRPSVALEKIQTLISSNGAGFLREFIGVQLKRNHKTIRALAEKYYNLEQIDPLDVPKDPLKPNSEKEYSFKDSNLRGTIAQLSGNWFQAKKQSTNQLKKNRAQNTPDNRNSFYQRAYLQLTNMNNVLDESASNSFTELKELATKLALTENKQS